MTPTQRRERCEKVHIELHGDCRGCAMTDYIEAFAIEIRDATLEEAAQICYRNSDRRVAMARRGHKHGTILLGEASGATICGHEIRALKSEGRE